MSKIQKTFKEGDEVSIPINWVCDTIWAYVDEFGSRDPAEVRYELSNKIKITVELYGEDTK